MKTKDKKKVPTPKQCRKKHSKRPLRFAKHIVDELAKNLPLLANDLIENDWNAGALFMDAVAESILKRLGLTCELPGGKTLVFNKYEVLGPDGLKRLLRPYEIESMTIHAPLMDHLEDDMLERLRAASDRYEAAWQKLLFAFSVRVPDDAALYAELGACRTELHNVVADLYLGERTPEINLDYYQPYARVKHILTILRTHLEQEERSILP